jgi:hypothetical protein
MNHSNKVEQYYSSLNKVYQGIISFPKKETPLGIISTEILEMISSYLSDAQSFREKNDNVNEYASVTYAHGWLDCGIYLGYLSSANSGLSFPKDVCIPDNQYDRLVEKTDRYIRMLNDAMTSVKIAPVSGSPGFIAAITICKKTQEHYNLALVETKGDDMFSVLGHLSYGYGWLDAGIRAGLFTIESHPELFTTETNKKL